MLAVLGAGLLLAALVLHLVAGMPGLLPSWAIAAAGLLLLRRDATTRAAAHAALASLAVAILVGALLAGVTVGSSGRTLATTPTLDPDFIVVGIGFVAVWIAAAVFLVVHETPRGLRAGKVALGLYVVGGALFALMQAKVVGLGDGGALFATLGIGSMLVVFALSRFAWRGLRARSPA